MKKNPHAAALGRSGGKVKSEAKAQAARQNGKLGGRPRKVMSESVDGFGVPLLEMANAIQKYTGLPGIVYFSTRDEVTNKQAHALGRVKWVHNGESVFVSIKAGKNGKRKSGGDPRMVSRLEKFVAANEELLWDYWITPAEKADSASVMGQSVRV